MGTTAIKIRIIRTPLTNPKEIDAKMAPRVFAVAMLLLFAITEVAPFTSTANSPASATDDVPDAAVKGPDVYILNVIDNPSDVATAPSSKKDSGISGGLLADPALKSNIN